MNQRIATNFNSYGNYAYNFNPQGYSFGNGQMFSMPNQAMTDSISFSQAPVALQPKKEESFLEKHGGTILLGAALAVGAALTQGRLWGKASTAAKKAASETTQNVLPKTENVTENVIKKEVNNATPPKVTEADVVTSTKIDVTEQKPKISNSQKNKETNLSQAQNKPVTEEVKEIEIPKNKESKPTKTQVKPSVDHNLAKKITSEYNLKEKDIKKYEDVVGRKITEDDFQLIQKMTDLNPEIKVLLGNDNTRDIIMQHLGQFKGQKSYNDILDKANTRFKIVDDYVKSNNSYRQEHQTFQYIFNDIIGYDKALRSNNINMVERLKELS